MAQLPDALDPLQRCSNCGNGLAPGKTYAFRSRGQGDATSPMQKCLRCALRHGPMLKRSLAAALVVGTVLTALNQGDLIISGAWNSAMLWKIPLTYCVPFVVATYGALTNSKS